MRRYTPRDNGSQPQHLLSSMHRGQALRAPTRRASADVVSGKHGILG